MINGNKMKFKKGTLIKLKLGKYKLFCMDKDFLVFGKYYIRGGVERISFENTVTFSALPEFKTMIEKYVIKAS